ncbi:hypothetical protein F4778DRAFT_603994 [Xylariomycetidae sp. FL2044]|nr:hypothetical protein F4778DRAFT_603994 [Xylariomycetidae sp. FL2044]
MDHAQAGSLPPHNVPPGNARILELPIELLLQIIQQLESHKDQLSCTLVCKDLYPVASKALLLGQLPFYRDRLLIWACRHEAAGVVRGLLAINTKPPTELIFVNLRRACANGRFGFISRLQRVLKPQVEKVLDIRASDFLRLLVSALYKLPDDWTTTEDLDAALDTFWWLYEQSASKDLDLVIEDMTLDRLREIDAMGDETSRRWHRGYIPFWCVRQRLRLLTVDSVEAELIMPPIRLAKWKAGRIANLSPEMIPIANFGSQMNVEQIRDVEDENDRYIVRLRRCHGHVEENGEWVRRLLPAHARLNATANKSS